MENFATLKARITKFVFSNRLKVLNLLSETTKAYRQSCFLDNGFICSRQSCTTVDPTRGSGRVGSGRVRNLQERAGRVVSGPVRPEAKF